MDPASDDEHHQFTSEDLAKLKSVVRRCAGKDLSEDDLDDIVGNVLLAAVVTARKPGTKASIAALAFTYANMASYYVFARTIAESVVATSQFGDGRADPRDPILALEISSTLSTLSPINREMIWLCDTLGLSLAEAADALDMSTATAQRRLKSAHNEFQAAWTA